eukprot:16448633-Heterocapsa_arctica.AAC.1
MPTGFCFCSSASCFRRSWTSSWSSPRTARRDSICWWIFAESGASGSSSHSLPGNPTVVAAEGDPPEEPLIWLRSAWSSFLSWATVSSFLCFGGPAAH